MTPDLWQRACERLAEQLPEQQFNTWIRPLPPAVLQHDAGAPAVLSVRVPNRFKLDWIRTQYAGRIESVLSELAGEPVRLELSLAARELPARAPALADRTAPRPTARRMRWPRWRCPRPAARASHCASAASPCRRRPRRATS